MPMSRLINNATPQLPEVNHVAPVNCVQLTSCSACEWGQGKLDATSAPLMSQSAV